MRKPPFPTSSLPPHRSLWVGSKEQLSYVKIAWNLGWVQALCRQDGWENITQLQGGDLTSAGHLLEHSLTLSLSFDKK